MPRRRKARRHHFHRSLRSPRGGRRRFYGEIAIWFEARDEDEAMAFLDYLGRKMGRMTQVEKEMTGPVELFQVDDNDERVETEGFTGGGVKARLPQ